MILFTLVDPIISFLKWDWLADITIWSIVIRLILAVLGGGIIGVERASKHHAAGFRTYILVCLGSSIAMMTNQFLFETFGTGDGARLGAQVISGIGFLGAGTILVTSRNQIRGLTTAAGLWGCACLGLAIGIGFYTLALVGFVIFITVLTFLPKIEKFFIVKSTVFEIHIEFGCRADLKTFISIARDMNLKIYSIEHNPAYASSGLSVYSITFNDMNEVKQQHDVYIKKFAELEFVHFVEEQFV